MFVCTYACMHVEGDLGWESRRQTSDRHTHGESNWDKESSSHTNLGIRVQMRLSVLLYAHNTD